jgi:DNA-binding LacI/PurR family transcriptional regulator
MARVTLKDVAAQAGVSYQTVSKVLNKQASVTAETENRIWEAIRELGYRPNISARNLRTQSSNLIGYGWQRSLDGTPRPVLDQFLYSAVQCAEDDGYHMLAFLSGDDVDTTLALYRDIYARRQVEGFILADTNDDDPRIKLLIEEGIPFASFGRTNDGWDFCWVDVDGRSGMRQITSHLQEQGHEKIALITWPEGSRAGGEREIGYFNQMDQAGLPVAAEWVRRGEHSVNQGYQLMTRLLNLPDTLRPTAVACVSDELAIGAMHAAMARGLAVGQDIAVTGYDNVPMSEFLFPPLTTVKQPIQQAGEWVIELLFRQINEETIEQKGILLEPELIVRQSS